MLVKDVVNSLKLLPETEKMVKDQLALKAKPELKVGLLELMEEHIIFYKQVYENQLVQQQTKRKLYQKNDSLQKR